MRSTKQSYWRKKWRPYVAKAKVFKADPVPDRGPDPLEDVKFLNLQLTPNELRALLLVATRIGGSSNSTLRGEFDTIKEELHRALKIDPGNNRFLNRNDIITGSVYFLKGGAHV